MRSLFQHLFKLLSAALDSATSRWEELSEKCEVRPFVCIHPKKGRIHGVEVCYVMHLPTDPASGFQRKNPWKIREEIRKKPEKSQKI